MNTKTILQEFVSKQNFQRLVETVRPSGSTSEAVEAVVLEKIKEICSRIDVNDPTVYSKQEAIDHLIMLNQRTIERARFSLPRTSTDVQRRVMPSTKRDLQPQIEERLERIKGMRTEKNGPTAEASLRMEQPPPPPIHRDEFQRSLEQLQGARALENPVPAPASSLLPTTTPLDNQPEPWEEALLEVMADAWCAADREDSVGTVVPHASVPELRDVSSRKASILEDRLLQVLGELRDAVQSLSEKAEVAQSPPGPVLQEVPLPRTIPTVSSRMASGATRNRAIAPRLQDAPFGTDLPAGALVGGVWLVGHGGRPSASPVLGWRRRGTRDVRGWLVQAGDASAGWRRYMPLGDPFPVGVEPELCFPDGETWLCGEDMVELDRWMQTPTSKEATEEHWLVRMKENWPMISVAGSCVHSVEFFDVEATPTLPHNPLPVRMTGSRELEVTLPGRGKGTPTTDIRKPGRAFLTGFQPLLCLLFPMTGA
jgi:hypothetical protein